jgi:dihydroorotase
MLTAVAELAIDGTFFIDGMLVKSSVGIRHGRIVGIMKNIEASERKTFDNAIIIPGAVDLHVHFREPGLTHKEDITTGSMSAAFGGVTCVADMPNTIPPTTTPERVEKKIELFKEKSYVDFAVYAALVKGVRVRELAKKAAGFKMFMGSSTGDLLCEDPDLQRSLIEAAAATGRPVMVHAEDESLRNRIAESNLRDHYRSRPPECEIGAIRTLIGHANTPKAPRIHVMHATLRESVELRHPKNLTFEATPHHLLLDCDMHIGAKGKVNPPLRRRDERLALQRAMLSGHIDTIGSDHAPHTTEEKEDDFDYAPSGIPGVETMLPLMLNMVATGELRLEMLVKMMCEKPARILGVKKGRIAEGYDADFLVLNMRKITTIRSELLHSKCNWTPFEGLSAIFPQSVYLRGRELVGDGSIKMKPSGKKAAV